MQSGLRKTFGLLLAFCATFFCISAEAQLPITKRVTVQPILVARGDGTGRINPNGIVNEAAVDKIWAQAGIDFKFLPPVNYDSDTYYNVVTAPTQATNYYVKLIAFPNQGQHPSNTVVNVWFVNTIDNNNFNGFALIGQNGAVIANRALNRLDTIAHELGHCLGLNHTTFGATGNTNLMTSNATQPGTLNDIFPTGTRSQLNPLQVTQVLVSGFVLPFVDEPAQPRLSISLSNNLPAIRITGEIGQICQLDYVPSVPAPGLGLWNLLELPQVILTNTTQTVLDTTFSGTARFYRARALTP